MKIINCEQDSLYTTIVSAVKRAELVSDRISYIDLRGHWSNIIVLNMHARSEEKSDNSTTVFTRNLSRFSGIFLRTI